MFVWMFVYSVYLRQATTLACKRHVQAMYKLYVQLPAVLMMYIVYMKSECRPYKLDS